MQIDAAINPGNSGGPAFKKDKVVGIARAHIKNAQNIGAYVQYVRMISAYVQCAQTLLVRMCNLYVGIVHISTNHMTNAQNVGVCVYYTLVCMIYMCSL